MHVVKSNIQYHRNRSSNATRQAFAHYCNLYYVFRPVASGDRGAGVHPAHAPQFLADQLRDHSNIT